MLLLKKYTLSTCYEAKQAKSYFLRLMSFSLIVLLVFLIGCQQKRVAPTRNLPSAPAPEFTLQDFSGNDLSSASLKGQIVVIIFWTTWSPGSTKDIPEFIALHTKYQDKVRFIGIALGEATSEDAKKMVAQLAVNYPTAVAPAEFYQNFGGIDAIPSTFVIDSQWNIVNRYTGRVRIDELSAELDYMLNPPKPQ